MSRGYFGIGICAGKTPENAGTLYRSAHAFGAAMVFSIAHRYSTRAASDTTKAHRHLPALSWPDIDSFLRSRPVDCKLVGVECGVPESRPLEQFVHPERALYVLGAEDSGLNRALRVECDHLVEIPSTYCLNVAVAGSVVLYDRIAKAAA